MKYLFLIFFIFVISCSIETFEREEIVIVKSNQIKKNNEAEIINEKEKTNNKKIISTVEKDNNTSKKSVSTVEKDNNISKKIIEVPKPMEKMEQDKLTEKEAYDVSFNEIIKIGILLPFSGKNKKLGRSISNALEMALFETKSENIELIFKDSGDDLDSATKASKELEKEGAAIIIGPVFSFQASEIRKIIREDIPIFSFTNDESVKSKGLWSLGFSPKQQIETIFQEMINHSVSTISIIVPENIYGDIILQASRKESILKNIKINQIYRYNKKARDFSDFSKYLNKDNSLVNEGLLIIASGKQLKEISSRAQYRGFNPKETKYFGISGWNDAEILGEPSLLGGHFVAPQQLSYETFVSRYFKLYDMVPNEISGLGYDILALLSIGLKNSHNTQELLKFLTNPVGFNGIFGLFKVSSQGDFYRKFIPYEVMERNFVKKYR
ncbi:MAG: hypothetical protein CFH33_00568 [Alphaproteobacteria bacterium MarineAlpha9_Bin3]|nr:MAG: hypothetical protein CFH33_00568 [Alphaproteobacteria bacterium MarineAlpha9_Bin3]